MLAVTASIKCTEIDKIEFDDHCRTSNTEHVIISSGLNRSNSSRRFWQIFNSSESIFGPNKQPCSNPTLQHPDMSPYIQMYHMIYNTWYKVPLGDVPRGVAQERNNIRSYEILHTCLEVVAVSTHH